MALIVVSSIYRGQLIWDKAAALYNVHGRTCKGCCLCMVKSVPCTEAESTRHPTRFKTLT